MSRIANNQLAYQVAILHAGGMPSQRIAEKLGLHPQSIWRILRRPAIQALVSSIRDLAFSETESALSMLLSKCMKVLEEDVDGLPPGQRSKLAIDVMNVNLKYREMGELNRRMLELERRLNQNAGGDNSTPKGD